VLSFPLDERSTSAGPPELGDVVICPEQTADLTEAVVHGVLHLCGHDHESDGGEMLALQRRVLDRL
jgi:probable rRNA maturation factor